MPENLEVTDINLTFATETNTSTAMMKLKLPLAVTMILLSLLGLYAKPTVVRPRTDKSKKCIRMRNENHYKTEGDPEFDKNARCFYLNGRLYFSFVKSEGLTKVSVTCTDTFSEHSVFVNSRYPFSVKVEEKPGNYIISLTTDEGELYIGEYIMEE